MFENLEKRERGDNGILLTYMKFYGFGTRSEKSQRVREETMNENVAVAVDNG